MPYFDDKKDQKVQVFAWVTQLVSRRFDILTRILPKGLVLTMCPDANNNNNNNNKNHNENNNTTTNRTEIPKYYACGKLALCSVCSFSVQLLIERRRLFLL